MAYSDVLNPDHAPLSSVPSGGPAGQPVGAAGGPGSMSASTAPAISPNAPGAESGIHLRFIIPVVVALLAIGITAKLFWHFDPSRFEAPTPTSTIRSAAVVPTEDSQRVIVVTATPLPPTATAAPTQTPWVLERVVIVTAAPTATAVPTQTPIVRWRQAACPTQPAMPVCQALPTPLPVVPTGMMRVCVDVAGVSGVFLDGSGVTGQSCTLVPAVGTHTLEVTG